MHATSYHILVTRRKKQNGKYPVKIRVVYQRRSKDFTIGLDLTEGEYNNAISERPKKEGRNNAIKIEEANLKAIKIIDACEIFTFKKFEDAFYGRIKDASDIFAIFDDYISILQRENRIKTAGSYTTAKNSFKAYKSKIGLYDIDKSFLQDYHSYQLQKKVTNKRPSHSESTIGIYIRSLRTIYNYAISKGIIKKDENYPFGKRQYVIPAGRNIKKALSIEEVKLIYDYKTVPYSQEDHARDFWMFSYLCNGINFKDLALLKKRDVDGEMLRFVREKTKNSTRGNQFTISCHINTQARSIIYKWESPDNDPDDYLFPVLKKDDDIIIQTKKIDQLIKTTNKYMKRICQTVGLNRMATTYYSRHSAATILKRSGASLQQIQEALGHHSAATTQKYLDAFDDDSKKELSKSLSNFL